VRRGSGSADDAALLCGTLANQIADHGEPRGDAEPHAQILPLWQSADRLDHRKAGSHRPLGIVLVRLRIAEIDQYPVTHVLGDKAVEAADRLADRTVVVADQLAQILRVMTGRQRRRADQIAEHHRQLAPLGLGGDRSSGGGRRLRGGLRRLGAKSGYRGEQLPPVADRCNPEADEIIGRQLRQNLAVDVVGGEFRDVLFEPEPAQPIGDVG
jgi:hypothetical protein